MRKLSIYSSVIDSFPIAQAYTFFCNIVVKHESWEVEGLKLECIWEKKNLNAFANAFSYLFPESFGNLWLKKTPLLF